MWNSVLEIAASIGDSLAPRPAASTILTEEHRKPHRASVASSPIPAKRGKPMYVGASRHFKGKQNVKKPQAPDASFKKRLDENIRAAVKDPGKYGDVWATLNRKYQAQLPPWSVKEGSTSAKAKAKHMPSRPASQGQNTSSVRKVTAKVAPKQPEAPKVVKAAGKAPSPDNKDPAARSKTNSSSAIQKRKLISKKTVAIKATQANPVEAKSSVDSLTPPRNNADPDRDLRIADDPLPMSNGAGDQHNDVDSHSSTESLIGFFADLKQDGLKKPGILTAVNAGVKSVGRKQKAGMKRKELSVGSGRKPKAPVSRGERVVKGSTGTKAAGLQLHETPTINETPSFGTWASSMYAATSAAIEPWAALIAPTQLPEALVATSPISQPQMNRNVQATATPKAAELIIKVATVGLPVLSQPSMKPKVKQAAKASPSLSSAGQQNKSLLKERSSLPLTKPSAESPVPFSQMRPPPQSSNAGPSYSKETEATSKKIAANKLEVQPREMDHSVVGTIPNPTMRPLEFSRGDDPTGDASVLTMEHQRQAAIVADSEALETARERIAEAPKRAVRRRKLLERLEGMRLLPVLCSRECELLGPELADLETQFDRQLAQCRSVLADDRVADVAVKDMLFGLACHKLEHVLSGPAWTKAPTYFALTRWYMTSETQRRARLAVLKRQLGPAIRIAESVFTLSKSWAIRKLAANRNWLNKHLRSEPHWFVTSSSSPSRAKGEPVSPNTPIKSAIGLLEPAVTAEALRALRSQWVTRVLGSLRAACSAIERNGQTPVELDAKKAPDQLAIDQLLDELRLATTQRLAHAFLKRPSARQGT